MKAPGTTLRAELEALLAEVERIAQSAAARRKRDAARRRLGGTALDAHLAPYFARVAIPTLGQLSPRIARARLRLDGLDEFPGVTSHAEFKALAALADRVGAASLAILAAGERACSSRERRRVRAAAQASGRGGRAA